MKKSIAHSECLLHRGRGCNWSKVLPATVLIQSNAVVCTHKFGAIYKQLMCNLQTVNVSGTKNSLE